MFFSSKGRIARYFELVAATDRLEPVDYPRLFIFNYFFVTYQAHDF
jgi:hypothetical protein